MRFLAVCLLALSGCALAAPDESSEQHAKEELRRICQELIDAVAPGEVEVWRKYLHERLIHVDENGVVRNKAELLKELAPLPPGLVGSISIDRFVAEIHGEVAVLAYEMQEHLDYHGQVLRSRFRASDTWLKGPQGWRLINQQVGAVLKDPPSIQLTQQQLCSYSGTFVLTEQMVTVVRCTASELIAERTGRKPATYLPEVADVFFEAGQPRSRRIFQRDAAGRITGFVDRREGEDIHWRKRSPE